MIEIQALFSSYLYPFLMWSEIVEIFWDDYVRRFESTK